jgi:hypothetical protein
MFRPYHGLVDTQTFDAHQFCMRDLHIMTIPPKGSGDLMDISCLSVLVPDYLLLLSCCAVCLSEVFGASSFSEGVALISVGLNVAN